MKLGSYIFERKSLYFIHKDEERDIMHYIIMIICKALNVDLNDKSPTGFDY